MKHFFYTTIICMCFGFCKCSSQQTHQPKTITQSVYTFAKASADGTGKFYLGREIAQVMGASGADWLERNDRQQEENTKLAIEKMNLPANAAVADIGAGTGYYTFKIAAKVPAGKVYAVEIQDELIDMLTKRKNKEHANNVAVMKGSEKTINLPAKSLDLIFMVDVYHELEYPHEVLQSLRSALKDTGKLLLIEYRGEDPEVAIKPLHKTTVNQLAKEMKANGFKLVSDGEFLPIQHFLLYSKTAF